MNKLNQRELGENMHNIIYPGSEGPYRQYHNQKV